MNSISKVTKQLLTLKRKLFTGVVTITAIDNQQWRLYLYRGVVLWGEGGTHGYRFWQRHLNKLCPQVDPTIFEQSKIISNSNTDYYFINTLLNKKIIPREQVRFLIGQKVITIIFDILQSENKQDMVLKLQVFSAYSLLKQDFNLTISGWIIDRLVFAANKNWSIWSGKGLTSCSPNLAPILKPNTQLEQQVSPVIFQNMKRMLNGKYSLRDLAVKIDKDVFDVTCTLVPYFFKGYIRLIEIPDLPGVKLPYLP